MKHFITYILLFISLVLSAQEQYPRIDKIEIENKIFHGQIDKFPIMIYLKFHQYSNYHMGVYSVKGWYYYEKTKIKMPIVGLYSGELTLYNFQDTAKANELLDFREMKQNHWEDMEYYQNLKNYNEKFVLNDSAYTWANNKKTFSVSLYDNDLSIKKTIELLRFDSKNVFDLKNLEAKDFKIKAQKGNQFILEYDYMSRENVMGMCGAGQEIGFMLLKFDKNCELINNQDFMLESCLQSIGTQEEKVISKYKTDYYCEDYTNDKSYILSVDTENIEIIKKARK
jgi:hypothetical protein